MFFVGDDAGAAPQPLYLCLGTPVETGASHGHVKDESQAFLGHTSEGSGNDLITVYDLDQVADSESEGSSTDEEQWAEENLHDPYPRERLEAEQQAARDPQYLTTVWLSQRMATRRYRAAKNTFGPKHEFGGRKIARKFTKR